ncbi:flagellar motor protein MotB [Mesorhizobium sp. B3-1-9]|nr:OmpA family protein [Mesorhizobium sp. B3-1-9]TPI34818.1 flagellar motor protein MotB [Mesorhizobium sp. B3-1-9]TPJ36710.1 flagellar motor protein MotB [Mesorhizobium sp. B2-8-3]
MKRQPRILAGTAIGLLMASAPLGAYPLQGGVASGSLHGAPLILAQAACAEGQSAEECAQAGGGQQGEQPRKRKREQQQQSESAPAEQAAPAESEQQPRKKRHDQQQTDNGQSGEAAPAEQQFKPRKKRDQQQQIEAAPADQGGQPATDEQPIKPRKKRDQQQQIEAAPADQGGQPATDEQQPRKKKRNQQQIEAAPADQQPAQQVAPAAGNQQQNDQQQGNQGRKKRKHDQQQSEPAGQTGEQVAPTEQTAPANDNQQGGNQGRKKHRQNQQNEAAPAGEPMPQAEPLQNGEQPVQGEQTQDKKKRGKKPAAEQPANGEQPATGEQPANGEQTKTGRQPATGEQQPGTGEQPANNNQPANGGNAAQGETANPNEAPVLDSQKDAVRKHRGRNDNGQNGGAQNDNGQAGNGQKTNQAGQRQGGEQAQRPAPVDQGPPPTDDKSAQQAIKPEKLVPVDEEKGKRIDRTPEDFARDRRRPKGTDVVKQFGDRVILQFNNQTFVESNEAPRITRGAKDVYYEDLSGGRTRETVERGNGVRVVTIRNRYGDVIQRSRVMPDGREYVLSYVDERQYQDDGDWRDPGDDLPPMRLTIPRRDYILDSEDVESDDDYYTFLEQPPVEKVQRLYSIDEVKRSARVRDIARRIDLDTLNFDFGSATISDTEVQKLDGVANAIEKLLQKNPAETFLIEGHTDAVGTPDANLALSDRRAEAVAEALTNAFGIPAENLTTQGYGEEYLKVNTPGPNRENRRVAIRRITSLVAPVASNSDQQ